MNEFNGYGLFNDVQDEKVKAFNRLMTLNNINQSRDKHLAKEYVELFNSNERAKIALTLTNIRRFGLNVVQDSITKGIAYV